MKFIGIDLGTTNSCISVMSEGKDEITTLETGKTGQYTLPSVVYYGGTEPVVGDNAKKKLFANADKTVKLAKTYLGTDKTWVIEGNTYTPIDVSADILKRLIGIYHDVYGDEPYECVITCPANYLQDKRDMVKQAAEQAGIEIKNLLNEPTAAAISFFENNPDLIGETVVIFDLGGGTLDVTVATCVENEDGMPRFEVRTSKGIERLGGANWDVEVQNELLMQCALKSGKSEEEIRSNVQDCSRIQYEAEGYKIALSSGDIDDDFTLSCTGELINFVFTQEDFERRTEGLLMQAMTIFDNALTYAFNDDSDGLEPVTEESIKNIILVGGSSRMPQIKNAILERHPAFEGKILLRDPDLSISKGAAYYCKMSGRTDENSGIVLTEKLQNSFGVACFINQSMIPLSPDSYSMRRSGLFGVCNNQLFAGDTLPCSNTEHYSTEYEGQPEIKLGIMQNNVSKDSIEVQYVERSKCKQIYDTIIPLPANTPKGTNVMIKMEADISGCLHVYYEVAGKSGEATIKIKSDAILSDSKEVDDLLGE